MVIIVNGGAISPNFDILEPSQVLSSATFEQANCNGDSAMITFSATGGDNLDSGGTYSYEYRVAGNTNPWVNVTQNPTSIIPTTDPQNIQIRATYTVGGESCLGAERTYTTAIDPAEDPILFSNTSGGVASSTTSTEGSVRTNYSGGSAPYTFVLTKENETTGIFETISNQNTPTGLNLIEFTGLGVGTYRITVIGNGCPTTTGDIEVTAAPSPQLGTPQTESEIFCNGGSDGIVSVAISGSALPFQYEYRLLDDGGVELRRDNDNEAILNIENLSAGNYTLEVIFDTGNFGPPASGVASVPISISDPNPLTFSVLDVAALDCNSPSDGYIEIQVSEAGDFEYTHRDLTTWVDLDPSGRIPATQSGDYDDLIIRKEPRLGDTVFCTSNIESVFVPGALSVSEVLSGHQNVTSNNGTDGAIEITVSGGNPGTAPNEYSFMWTGTLLNGDPYTNNTDQNLQNLSAGSYTVLVIDNKTCEATLGPIQITEPGALDITGFVPTPVQCQGEANGSITAIFTGTGTLDFLWERVDGQPITSVNNATISGLTAGEYRLTLTDPIAGASDTGTVTIEEPALITANIVPTPTCFNSDTGMITITGAMGGTLNPTSNYSYSIDGGMTFQNTGIFEDLALDNYDVVIEEDGGCRLTRTIAITATDPITLNTITTVVNNVSAVGLMDGSISPVFEGGLDDGVGEKFQFVWSGDNVGGVTDQNVSGLGPGTYSVEVTDDAGCVFPQQFVIIEPGALSVTISEQRNPCFMQNNGSITADVVGTGPYNLQWSEAILGDLTGETNLTLENIGPGTYTLNVIDLGETPNTVGNSPDVVLLEPAAITADINTTPSCAANDTGTIVISNVQGGEPGSIQDYTYSLDGVVFQDEPLFENQDDATYQVWVRDGNGCDGIFSGITVAPSPPIEWDEPNTVVTNATAQNATDGTITQAFTSDATNYTYEWNGPGTVDEMTQNLTGKAAGAFTVIVTNEDGCTLERIFTIAEPGVLTVEVNTTKNPCFGENNGNIQMTVVGTGTLSYQWSEDLLGDLGGETGPNLNNAPAGTYTLTVTDTAVMPANVVSRNAIPLSDPASILEAQATPTDAQCAGDADGMVTVNATGGIPPYEYSIDGGATYQAGATFANLGLGTYSFRVRDSNDCVADAGATINEPTQITLTATATSLTAAGASDGAIDIAASGGTGDLGFSWTGPAGFAPTTQEDISGLAAGDYIVTVTDENGCMFVSDPIVIDEPGAIIITLTINEEILCNGDEIGEILADVQGGVPDYTYQWFREGNNTPLGETTNLINNLGAGRYFLRVTDANGVSRDSAVRELTEPTVLQVNLQNKVDIVCSGEASGSINIAVQGGTLPYTFQWSNGAASQNLANIEAGDYFVEVFDDNGCFELLEVTINPAPDALQLEATVTNVSEYLANDGGIALNITGGATPYTINWTRDSDGTPAGNSAAITALSADSYTVFVSDANGCNLTETFEVTQPDIVEDTIVQPNCQGDTNGSISVLVNQGNGAFTYLWSTGETTNAISNLGAGDYSITITGFGDGPLTRTYTLEDPLPLEVDLGQDRVLCADQVLELDATVDDETATYTWTSDTGFSSTEPSVTLTTTGNYTVTVQTASGCTAVGALFLEVSTDNIDAEFAMSSQVFTGDILVAVDISFPLPEIIEWQVPEGATVVKQDSDEVELIFDQAGEYEITIVTKRGDCIAQKTKKVLVVAKDGSVGEDDANDPNKLVEDFIVYPNPTTGRFTADVSLTETGNISIKVFNFSNNAMMASERGRGETSYSIPFDISGMPSGVYAVLLETPYGTSLRKIVVR